MKFIFVPIALLLFLTGCAQVRQPTGVKQGETIADIRIAPFSESALGGLPNRWEPMIIHRNKKNTQYALVAEQGRHVLHARAVSASSGLMQKVNIDPMQKPQISWRWRISGLVESADNFDRALEDSPARVILGFDGNKDELPFADQIMFETARMVTGRELPYATLMYIWGRRAPVDTVIPNTRSNRIKMIVAASGADGVGEWQAISRDIVADYERAFGGKPGRLIAVGVLTDTDNTGETVEAWYGDIRLKPQP
ncbi:DUF3047 domain-containing protein [Herminiimonas fonticola]|uniref:DUF3047 domain-containing protein n=1 Tax=Herminiimonas fonticola TaxID=303380 RepID=UPI00333F9EBF